VPAGAGTGGHRAGQILQRCFPVRPYLDIKYHFDGFPDGGQAGPARRLTDP
jgi:hypothetical protein